MVDVEESNCGIVCVLALLVCGACDRKWKSGEKSWAEGGGLPEAQPMTEAKPAPPCTSLKPIDVTVPMQQLGNRTSGRIDTAWQAEVIPILACKYGVSHEEVLDVLVELETALSQQTGYLKSIIEKIFILSAEYKHSAQYVARLVAIMRHDPRFDSLAQAEVLANLRAILAGVRTGADHALWELANSGGNLFPLIPHPGTFEIDEADCRLSRQVIALALSEPGNAESNLDAIRGIAWALPDTLWVGSRDGAILTPTLTKVLLHSASGKTVSAHRLPWLKGPAKQFMSPILARFQEALANHTPEEAAKIALAKYIRLSAAMEEAYTRAMGEAK